MRRVRTVILLLVTLAALAITTMSSFPWDTHLPIHP